MGVLTLWLQFCGSILAAADCLFRCRISAAFSVFRNCVSLSFRQRKKIDFRVGSGIIAAVYGKTVFIYFAARHAFRLGRVHIAIAGAV